MLRGLEVLASFPEAHPIKINAVAIRDFTEEEALPFAEFARRTPYEVRFIEFMPLDADHAWTADQVLTGAEIRGAIDAVYPLEPEPREPHATARIYRFADGQRQDRLHQPGLRAFCGDCNRIRLTADGHLRTCLFSLNETDLRDPMRDGAERRRARADHPRRGLAQGAQAPRRRAGLHPADAHDVRDRRLITPQWLSAASASVKGQLEMLLLMLFALIAGAGTAITPCVLPVLPALLSASAAGGRRRPLGIVLGLAVTFTIAIVALAQLVKGVGLASGAARTLAIVVLIAFRRCCC